MAGGEGVFCGWDDAAQATMVPERNSKNSIVLNKPLPYCLSNQLFKTIRVFRITLRQDQ